MGTADIFWIDFFPAIGIRTDCLFENYLYKKHIQDSPSADAQQHIMLPLMYAENEGRREKFRDSMGTLQDGNGFEAIDYQHGHGRKRQDRAEVINNFRSLFPRRKEQKGERRVRMVTRAITKSVISICMLVIGTSLLCIVF